MTASETRTPARRAVRAERGGISHAVLVGVFGFLPVASVFRRHIRASRNGCPARGAHTLFATWEFDTIKLDRLPRGLVGHIIEVS